MPTFPSTLPVSSLSLFFLVRPSVRNTRRSIALPSTPPHATLLSFMVSLILLSSRKLNLLSSRSSCRSLVERRRFTVFEVTEQWHTTSLCVVAWFVEFFSYAFFFFLLSLWDVWAMKNDREFGTEKRNKGKTWRLALYRVIHVTCTPETIFLMENLFNTKVVWFWRRYMNFLAHAISIFPFSPWLDNRAIRLRSPPA